MKNCAWCATEFYSKVSYQIYCSVECRTEATKQKITDRYNSKRIIKRKNKETLCSGGCGTKISIYNENNFCNMCLFNQKKVNKMLKELRGFFEYEQVSE